MGLPGLEYWKLPETLETQREPVYNELLKLIEAKIEYIQFCYSNTLTAGQLARVKQDEDLIAKMSEYTELVSIQFNSILEKYIALCGHYTELQHEKNAILNKSLTELKKITDEVTKGTKQL